MGQVVGCVRVKESNVGIKEVFEKYDDVLQPGCHYVPWYLGRRVATISLGFRHYKVPYLVKTKDNVLVTVVACIQYRVLEEMVVEAHYKIDNPGTHISRYVANVITSLVPKMDLDSVFEQKNEIAAAIQKEIEKAMSAFGFEILQTFIMDIRLAETVEKAMNEAMKLKVDTKAKAEAEKMLQLNRAEGSAESKYLTGLGMARQFQAIADGVSDNNKLAFSDGVANASATTSSKDIMDMVLANQQFDTIKEISASTKSNSVFISNGNVAVKDIASQMKDGLLLVQENAAAAAAANDTASQLKNAPVQTKGKTPAKA